MQFDDHIDREMGLDLIREALEGVLDPLTVSAVVFEALAAGEAGELPNDRRSLLDFARSSIRWAVETRLDDEAGQAFVERVEQMLEHFSGTPQSAFDADATAPLTMETLRGPVHVLMLSGNPAIRLALQSALTYQAASVQGAETVRSATHAALASPPEIVIIDALMPVSDPVPAIVDFLSEHAFDATRLIWGAEQGWGAQVARALESQDVHHTPVDSREGVEPMIDFVRARSQQR